MNLLFKGAAALPRPQLLYLGRTLGNTWFDHLPVRRGWTRAHLTAVFPDLNTRAIDAIARRVFICQATNTLELLAFRRLLQQPVKTLSWMEVEGREHLEAARAQGRGILVLTAHIGNYDLLAAHQALSGEKLHIVSKRLKHSGLNRLWMNLRAELGVEVIALEGVVREALAVLRRGDSVAFVLDQHSPEARAFEGPFLGLPARTTHALSLLALRSKAPILPVFIRRDPRGKHTIRFSAPFQATDRDATTRRCLDIIESAVLEQPDQWLWLHRRWKSAEGQPLIRPQGRISITASSSTTR